MKKKVSLKDIAQAAGVSTALVSYVLNNKEKEARVGKEIAKKIREIAKELDYQPNQLAISLKSGKSQTIGLILADISNPFFGNIARIIEDEAKKYNYTVIFGSSDENHEKSSDLINVLVKRQVDGFIIAPAQGTEKQIEYLEHQNIPLVLIDRYFPSIDTNFVATENFRAAYDAVNHLVETGHKNIGMITYHSDLIHMEERKRGYLTALQDNKVFSSISLIKEINFDSLKEEVDVNVRNLLSEEPAVDALFFSTNTLALNGLKTLDKLGYRIPDDLAIVCFDEGEAFDFFYSPITFISQPLVQVGKEAVNILINQINNPSATKKQLLINSQLVIRKSSGA